MSDVRPLAGIRRAPGPGRLELLSQTPVSGYPNLRLSWKKHGASVWRSLILLASRTFPRLPLVGYESGSELAAALDAGFEIGDPLRIWVRARD